MATVRECGDIQGGIATVREVWRLSERCGDCERVMATFREV